MNSNLVLLFNDVTKEGGGNTALGEEKLSTPKLKEHYPAEEELEEESWEEFSGIEEGIELPEKFVLQCLHMNEAGDAKIYQAINKHRFVIDLESGQWHVYRGPHWEADLRDESLQEGVTAVIDVYQKLVQKSQRRLLEQDAPSDEAGKRHQALARDVRRKIDHLDRLAYRRTVREAAGQGREGLGICGRDWDKDPWLLCCPNGVINLKTGELLEAHPEFYLRRRAETEYSPWRKVPEKFLSALRDIFPYLAPRPDRDATIQALLDAGVDSLEAEQIYLDQLQRYEELRSDYTDTIIDFLQVLLGYSLIGEVLEHILVIFYGRGRNGKTLLVELLQKVLGDYAHAIQPEILLASPKGSSSGAASPDILNLMGRRLVFASETNDSSQFDSSKVKRLVGGDTLTGRHLYARSYTEFTPSHTLFLLTNNKPNAPGDDFALWKRIVLLPFEVSFVAHPDPAKPEERQCDPLLGKILLQEATDILGWLVEGARRYRREGLRIPEVIQDNIRQYREEVDVLGRFLADSCEEDPNFCVQAAELYDAYQYWCRQQGHGALSSTKLGAKLAKRYHKTRKQRGIFYVGLRIAPDFWAAMQRDVHGLDGRYL